MTGEAMRSEWVAAQARLRVSREANLHALDPVCERDRLVSMVQQEASICLDRMRQADPDLAELLSFRVDRWVESALQKDTRAGLHLASKIMSLFDCCVDEEIVSLSVSALPLEEQYVLDPLAGVTRLALTERCQSPPAGRPTP